MMGSSYSTLMGPWETDGYQTPPPLVLNMFCPHSAHPSNNSF